MRSDNLLERAINNDDSDHAESSPKIVNSALGPGNWLKRECGIWPDMQFSQFFEFVIVVVVVGSLIVLAAAGYEAPRQVKGPVIWSMAKLSSSLREVSSSDRSSCLQERWQNFPPQRSLASSIRSWSGTLVNHTHRY